MKPEVLAHSERRCPPNPWHGVWTGRGFKPKDWRHKHVFSKSIFWDLVGWMLHQVRTLFRFTSLQNTKHVSPYTPISVADIRHAIHHVSHPQKAEEFPDWSSQPGCSAISATSAQVLTHSNNQITSPASHTKRCMPFLGTCVHFAKKFGAWT